MARKKKRRQFTVEQKLKILEEARQPETTVAEVCRRHGIDGSTFYRWEKKAKAGMREALGRKRRRGSAEREQERLKRELERKRRIIAEVVQENLELKKSLSD